MPSKEVNIQAKTNGDWGEERALPILKKKFGNVEFMNELIDYYANNNIPIEVKTCQFSIKSGNENYPDRHGRFLLNKPQHEILQHKEGYYLFLVKLESLLMKASLIKAKDLNFTRQLTWTMIL